MPGALVAARRTHCIVITNAVGVHVEIDSYAGLPEIDAVVAEIDDELRWAPGGRTWVPVNRSRQRLF